ncbi:F-box domain-containing protein [Mycena venus]|uniref:F-box domain-containing protein n=1 Tax=Mycena venus TaxID=2733690 RepID=A0A8H7CNV6_9AGAR|nr:F-box domain-containing protein [Mycena venus]
MQALSFPCLCRSSLPYSRRVSCLNEKSAHFAPPLGVPPKCHWRRYPVPSMLSNLEADRTRVEDIAARILDLECSIAELRAEQATVQERLNSYRYPVLTLPNEIISEIFIHFLPIYPLCPPLIGILSPICLTHICHKWRAIALATPALWKAIQLSSACTTSTLRNNGDTLIEIFETWLNRSGCCPVSIEINEHGAAFRMPDIIPAIVPHRARLEHLDLYLYDSFLPLFGGPMPLLRYLDLGFRTRTPFTLLDVPQLRTVVLDQIAVTSATLPWVQLTSLTLHIVEPRLCLLILQQTTSLIHCVLGLGPEDESADHPGTITLPCLKSLVLFDIPDGPHVADFELTTFILPTLRKLEISEKFLGTNPIESLASFISTSGCKLRKMCIAWRKFGSSTPEDSYLAAFPHIPSFSFEYDDESSDEEESESDSD